MKMHAAEVPHLPLLVGSVAVLLLGTCGITAVMAWTPASTGVAAAVIALDKLPATSAGPIDAQAQTPPALTKGSARARVKCEECGFVASMREVGQPGAAGGVTGDGRNEMPGQPARSYEVIVRMKDGSSRAFMDAHPANWRAGERVIFIEGASQPGD